jgi:small-conductance mechanosensitive channel
MNVMQNRSWGNVNSRLIPYAILFIVGAVVCRNFGDVRHGSFEHKLIALIGLGVFLAFSTLFMHLLTKAIHGLIAFHRLGAGRAASIQFILRLFGYIAILLTTLDLVSIPVGRILLGSAVLGIILGVAAQQALANFFASIMLIISHPFAVGQEITLISGALGGKHIGTVEDIGLSHTRLKEKDGAVVLLPNATLLSGASIMVHKHPSPSELEHETSS